MALTTSALLKKVVRKSLGHVQLSSNETLTLCINSIISLNLLTFVNNASAVSPSYENPCETEELTYGHVAGNCCILKKQY